MKYLHVIPLLGLLLLLSVVLPSALAQQSEGGLDGLANKKDFRAGRASRADPMHHNRDFAILGPGNTTLLADIKGAGRLTHIWFTTKPSNEYSLRALVLRITWDDASKPAVECPLGDFFVQGGGRYLQFSSEPITIGAFHALNCYWPMPFSKHAVITIANEGRERIDKFYYQIDYRLDDRVIDSEAMRYFHVQYRNYFPAPTGEDLVLLETSGIGHYVGCNITVLANSDGWWGEGNDKFYIDGASTPTIEGTGTEDYFCGAWDFGHAFSTPNFGVPLYMGSSRGDTTVCYRWHIKDPIPFQKSLKFTLEHGRNGPDDDREPFTNHYTTVAYYYLDRPSDETPVIPPYPKRIPTLIPLNR